MVLMPWECCMTTYHVSRACAYMPYRGPGHLNLTAALQTGQTAECYLDENGQRSRFIVVSIPKYGILEVVSVCRDQQPA